MGLLSTLPTVSGPSALAPLRERARKALDEKGLPTKKTEAWRFTRVDHLVGREHGAADVQETSAGWAMPSDSWRALFRGGQILADADFPPGLSVFRLGDAPEELALRLGTVAENEHFVALSSACFTDALVLVAKGVVETTVELDYEAVGTTPAYPRVLVVLEKGAQLRLVERAFGEGALTVQVTEVVIGDGAGLDHVRVHTDRGALLGTVAVTQGRDARYTSHVASFGGGTVRLDLDVRLEGPGAEARLDGVYLVDETEHVDHHVRVDHVGPRCTSHQRYRGVLDGKGTAVFDGQAIVHRSAPGSEAHQQNRNLLVSEKANVFTKPHLEIDNDDVVASHGATVGALDDDQLFYLRSRGIPAPVARGMLTFAFLRELVDAVPIEVLREDLADAMLRRLPESDRLRSYFTELE